MPETKGVSPERLQQVPSIDERTGAPAKRSREQKMKPTPSSHLVSTIWTLAATVALLECGSSPGSLEGPSQQTPAATYTITASVGPNGSVSPSGSVSVMEGASQRFTFTPDSGFIINAVSVDGGQRAAIPRHTFSNVRADHTLDVTFKAIRPLTPQVLAFLDGISGTWTVAGQHNKEPNSAPAAATDRVFQITGRYPGLWSGDFLFVAGSAEPENRWTMIYEAKGQWDNGALVNLMWHACPPTQAEPCAWVGGVTSSLTDAQWTDLVTDGGALNDAWKRRLDDVAVYLQYLEDNGVEVLWRPFHEMNQGLFWWGGRPGPDGTARLFQMTRDYLVDVKGLTHLIWVWDIQDFWTDPASAAAIASDIQPYNPGADYWQVVALDPYSTGFTQQNYEAMRTVAGSRPMAIGECQFLPTGAFLASQPRWVFFMLWPDFIAQSSASLPPLYAAANVLTQDEMPGWQGLW